MLAGVLTLLVIPAGVQDLRSGEVSNWITIPLLACGLVAAALRMFRSGDGIILASYLFGAAVLTMAALRGWMGGADWKVLLGLFGVLPLAGFAALVTAGIWGGILMVLFRSRNIRFPGVTAYATGTCLAFLYMAWFMLLE